MGTGAHFSLGLLPGYCFTSGLPNQRDSQISLWNFPRIRRLKTLGNAA